jgi:hypothetical protein
LFPGGLASGGLSSCLLGTCHCIFFAERNAMARAGRLSAFYTWPSGALSD